MWSTCALLSHMLHPYPDNATQGQGNGKVETRQVLGLGLAGGGRGGLAGGERPGGRRG